jgi:photosystem II stability/assembly factor-like uncharacterized protein
MKVFLTTIFFGLFNIVFCQDWVNMANDYSINLYDVVEEAESYFQKIDKSKKGSGWKKYQRWLYENEPKFYPSGDRSNIDPYHSTKEFKKFLKNSNSNRLGFNNGWQELGPHYIEEVTGHYAVGLGRIESFYVDPNNPEKIFLGSRSGGFWKTLSGGDLWENTTDFLFASGVNAIAVSPDNPNRILINVRNSHNGTTHGIYESLDGGDTWAVTNFNPDNLNWGGLGTNNRINKIMYHPTIPNLVFVGTSEGLYRSVDNFESYVNIAVGNHPSGFNQNFDFIEFHPTNENIIYTSTTDSDSKIYISTNTGQSFNQSGEIANNNSNIKLSISAACEDCVYIGSSDGVWKSENLAETFELIGSPEIANYGAFAVSDTDPNVLLFGDIDTHMSYDGGQTWSQVTYWATGDENYNTTGQYVHADIRGARSFNGVFWVNTDGLLAKSNDNGASWEFFEGQSIRENYCLGVSQSNHSRTITGSQDNGTSIKNENTWIEFYGADGMEGIIHPLNDDWMIGSVQNGSKRRTKDGGYSQDGATPNNFSGAWVTPLLYNPNDQMSIYTASNLLYKSEDFGSNWTPLSESLFDGNINNVVMAENNSEIIAVTQGSRIKISTNGGINFYEVSSPILPSSSIKDIAFDPNNDNIIIVTYASYSNDNKKIFLSNNLGQSWSNITYNLGNMPIRCVAIDHTEDSTIYVGAEIGVYKKVMSENTWELYNENLPNTTIMELEVVYGSNTLRATTWGRGVWECSLAGRENYPSIKTTRISNQPTEYQPKESLEQFVNSLIQYDEELINVYVEWLTDTSSGIIPMLNDNNDNWVSETHIPNFEQGKKVFFKVFAESVDGLLSETYKFMYEVRENVFCTPSMDCSVGDGFQLFQLGDIDNESECEGYGDFTDLSTELNQGEDYSLTVTTGYGDQYVKVWIDFNDDTEFSEDEVIVDNFIVEPDFNGAGTFSETIDVSIPEDANLGEHILRAKTNWAGNVPTNACEETTYGETEDYTVIISSASLGLIENDFSFTPIIYPNPTTGKITIDLFNNLDDVSVILTDVNGKRIFSKNYFEVQGIDLNINQSTGIYLLTIISENKKAVFKLIKK